MECAIYRGKILNGVGKNFNLVFRGQKCLIMGKIINFMKKLVIGLFN